MLVLYLLFEYKPRQGYDVLHFFSWHALIVGITHSLVL